MSARSALMVLALLFLFFAYTNSVYAPDWLIPVLWLLLLGIALLMLIGSSAYILLEAIRHPAGNPLFLSMGDFRRREIIAHMHQAVRQESFHQRL